MDGDVVVEGVRVVVSTDSREGRVAGKGFARLTIARRVRKSKLNRRRGDIEDDSIVQASS